MYRPLGVAFLGARSSFMGCSLCLWEFSWELRAHYIWGLIAQVLARMTLEDYLSKWLFGALTSHLLHNLRWYLDECQKRILWVMCPYTYTQYSSLKAFYDFLVAFLSLELVLFVIPCARVRGMGVRTHLQSPIWITDIVRWFFHLISTRKCHSCSRWSPDRWDSAPLSFGQ